MPNLNGKGPFGEGPRTGRGRGRCRKKNSKNIEKSDVQATNSKNSDVATQFRGERNREGVGLRRRNRFRNRD